VITPSAAGVARPVVPTPATASAPPTLPVSDRGDEPRLRAPDLTFVRPTTLRILGDGRFGTWSLIGSTIGDPCTVGMSRRCFDLVFAELGIAWRPFGSRVSLFSTVGMVPVTMPPAASLQGPATVGFQFVSGLRIDLPVLRARPARGLSR
jgi:hypothetical protein